TGMDAPDLLRPDGWPPADLTQPGARLGTRRQVPPLREHTNLSDLLRVFAPSRFPFSPTALRAAGRSSGVDETRELSPARPLPQVGWRQDPAAGRIGAVLPAGDPRLHRAVRRERRRVLQPAR